MADNNNAGGDADSSSSSSRYFKKLSDSFVGRFKAYQQNPNDGDGQKRRPLDRERYFEEDDGEQSNTCSRLAVQFYNQQPENTPISLLYAKDSHKFCVEDDEAYYHVNFKAAAHGDGKPYTFFAEVTGREDPATVTMVTLFLTKEERKTRDNCLYCTGLRHPKEGGFVGHQPQAEESDTDTDNSDGQ